MTERYNEDWYRFIKSHFGPGTGKDKYKKVSLHRVYNLVEEFEYWLSKQYQDGGIAG